MNHELERVKREGRIFAGIVFGVLVFLIVTFFASNAAAETTWETYAFPDGQGALSISDQPCSVPVAMEKWDRIRAYLKARFNDDLGEVRQSRLLWHGQVYAGCYAIGPDNGHVYNIDSLGEALMPTIPREAFVPHEGVLPTRGTAV